MPKYLVFNPQDNLIEVRDEKLSDCTAEYKSQQVFGNLVPVWHTSKDSVQKVARAVMVFSARQETKLIADVQSAAKQLIQKFNPKGTAFLSVGASPKLVKWLLKKLGFQVETINVSGVCDKATPTNEFGEYLKRKLEKFGSATTFVLMDFADTGASLYQLKKDVKKLRPQAAVQTAAIGKSEMLDKEVNKKYKDDLDLIVTGIDSLQKDLREQRLKYYVVGRNKKKNPYAEWSSKNVKLETDRMPGKGKSFHEHFQHVKSYLPEALAASVLDDIDVDELLRTAGVGDEAEEYEESHSQYGSEGEETRSSGGRNR